MAGPDLKAQKACARPNSIQLPAGVSRRRKVLDSSRVAPPAHGIFTLTMDISVLLAHLPSGFWR